MITQEQKEKLYTLPGWAEYIKEGQWLPFEEAREFARSLKLKSSTEWVAYRSSGKRPSNVPSVPYEVYKTEWISFPDWLGYKGSCEQPLPFKQARAFVRALKLKSWGEWSTYSSSGKRPSNIPSVPG
jgi:hypothetical protein